MCSQLDHPPYDEPVVAPPRPTCDRVIRFMPRQDGWGSRPVRCHRQVGVTTWTDASGVTRAACADHVAAVKARHPEAEKFPCGDRHQGDECPYCAGSGWTLFAPVTNP